MEPRFRHDFSKVRVHTGLQAADSARAVEARAYTVGHHVVLGAGTTASFQSAAGSELLAHELTHVVQQSSVSADRPGSLEVGDPSDAAEREADQIAHSISGKKKKKKKKKPTESLKRRCAIPLPSLLPPELSLGIRQPRVVPRAFDRGGYSAVAMQRWARNPATPLLIQRSLEGNPEHDVIQRQADMPGALTSAEAAPSAGGMNVFFCSKPVARFARHAFFRVGGDGPGNHTYELEHDERGDHCPCGIQGIPMENYPEDRDSTDAMCVPAPAISATCLAQKWDSYPRGNYCAWGPNSNTYARVTAEACGDRLRPPGALPGFADTPPAAGTANPAKDARWQMLGCDRARDCNDTGCHAPPGPFFNWP